jgi:Spy/CpxP family protein refolding chaperone
MGVLVLPAVIRLVTTAVILLGSGAALIAAEGQARPAVAAPRTNVYYAPGMWSLRLPGAGEEIGLSDEQDKKIQDIGQQYTKDIQQLWAGLKELKPAERQKKYQELRGKQQALMQAAQKKTREVLSDEQWDKLLLLQVRRRGPWLLNNAAYQKKLSISDEQKASIDKKIEQLQEKMKAMQAKMQKLRERASDDIFKLLTDEQINKLKEMESSGRPYALGGQAAGGQPPRVQIRRAPQAERKSD